MGAENPKKRKSKTLDFSGAFAYNDFRKLNLVLDYMSIVNFMSFYKLDGFIVKVNTPEIGKIENRLHSGGF
ncbi:hypothetical protein [Faecalicatena contorta]|uniref:hypothetical protein n=1 Tax=Faecalicatena contorta TaxID=39482 RepID=UPI000D6B1CB6|nr:hypothetical protein [Faecalicatena contorta]